jgi:hypothetical protein
MGHTVRHLPDAGFPAQRTIRLRHSGLAEIFLRQDVRGNLAPLFGNLNMVHLKNHFARRIFDDRGTVIVFKHVVGRNSFAGELAGELQSPGSFVFGWHIGLYYGVKIVNELLSGTVNENIFQQPKFISVNINKLWIRPWPFRPMQ